ncbi:DUF4835 family protein [uncultured Flavobacterium sp.]|uniref:type IX secretion system protein PorD n=1 Tax=uncultured Flavobacterium sp. TaxID=165435 RepID=UPI0030EDBA4D|tara:strand:- start:3438 stop:4328 length:891 start_codon:yes stop_codon:yes gene_type:complete
MKKLTFIVAFLFLVYNANAQELKATVTINYDRVTNVNTQIFKTLQTQMTEFLNNTKFTNQEYEQNEKIECSFFLNIASYDSNNFGATLQLQSSRPIFNSSYTSPIVNFNDNDVNFRYIEYENFIYDPNSYTSNLISILAYYSNVVIGLDKDSFEEMGGTKQLEIASGIMNLAQSSGYGGWSQSDAKYNNRYYIISDILSSTYSPYREALYEYHLKGLDFMAEDQKAAKEKILEAIKTISQINKVRPNALLTRTFFDAKSDEIVSVFSGGPAMPNNELLEILNKISPLNSSKWNKIR